MVTTKTLEQQLVDVQQKQANLTKQTDHITKQIQAAKDKKKPKSIMDKVKTIKDVLRITKPSKEIISIINYKGRDELLIHLKYEIICVLIAKALNEGWTPKMDGVDKRYYAWFYINNLSDFWFRVTYVDDNIAAASSASRLCFKNRILAEYAATQFVEYYKGFLTF